VDDDPGVSDLAAELLEREDEELAVETATSASEGLDRLADGGFDCVVTGYDMPGRDGIEFLEAVHEEHPELPFILFTGKGSEAVASETISAGVTDYLQKEAGTEQYAVLATRIRNVVTRYRRERELQQEQRRFEMLFERLTQPAVEVEFDGETPIVTAINSTFEETFRYGPDEIVGESLDAYVVPEDRTAAAEEIKRRALAGERLFSEEVVRETADGRRDFLIQNAVYEDGSKEFAIYTDITDRKGHERELERYETIVEALGDPVYAIDDEGRYTFVNDAFTRMTGYSEAELLGEHTSLVVSESTVEKGVELTKELRRAEEGATRTCEMEVITADGERIPCENHVVLLPFDEDGEFRGTAGVVREVTERRERKRELERQNERLEEFASIISHDLQSPLSVVEGRVEHAQAECDSGHLEVATRSLERMNQLIDRTLTLARSGQVIGETGPVDLAGLAEQSWRNVDTADSVLRVEGDPVIEANEDRLRHLFENLYRNAVEHGGPDVTVTVGVLDDEEGIPGSEREEVLAAGYSTTESGTGLGLSIVRQIAKAHGWEIEVAEAASGGSRFEISGVAVDAG
jgi:PAS domain S-box-containing protein